MDFYADQETMLSSTIKTETNPLTGHAQCLGLSLNQAVKALGLEELQEAVLGRFKGDELLLEVTSSQANGKLQSFLRAYGTIVKEEYVDGGVVIEVKLGTNQLGQLRKLGPSGLTIKD